MRSERQESHRSETKHHGVDWSLKTLRISDYAHRMLTRWLGEMMAQSGKPQTFSDVIEALVSRSVLLPPELLDRVEEFIQINKQQGYLSKEEFIREVVNETLQKVSTRPTR